MPTIFILDAIKIMIFFDDHSPPHFHAVYNEHEELIIIPTLETIRGRLPRNQRKKLEQWANGHMEFIIKKWNEFNPDSKI